MYWLLLIFGCNPLFFLAKLGLRQLEIDLPLGDLLDVFTGEWMSRPFTSSSFNLVPEWSDESNSTLEAVQARRLSKDGLWHDTGYGDNDGQHMRAWAICERDIAKSGDPFKSNGHGYFLIQECATWADHLGKCKAAGAYLAKIDSWNENHFVAGIAKKKATYIGLSNADGRGWKWTDESKATFTAWSPGQPDGRRTPNYAFMNFWEEQGVEYVCDDMGWLGPAIMGAIILLILLLYCFEVCIACCYKMKVTDKRQPFPDANANAQSQHGLGGNFADFRVGICNCFEDCGTCMHAFFCFWERASDTFHVTQAMPYWCTFATMVGVSAIFTLIDYGIFWLLRFDPNFRGWAAGLIVAGIMSQNRQKLRSRLGQVDAQRTCCMDFLCWWLCGCCVATQEARVVDAIQGVHQECLCNLAAGEHPTMQRYAAAPQMQPGAGMVIGQPVGVQAPVMGQVITPAGAVPGQATVVQATAIEMNNKVA